MQGGQAWEGVTGFPAHQFKFCYGTAESEVHIGNVHVRISHVCDMEDPVMAKLAFEKFSWK